MTGPQGRLGLSELPAPTQRRTGLRAARPEPQRWIPCCGGWAHSHDSLGPPALRPDHAAARVARRGLGALTMPSGWTRKRGSTWTWYIEDVPDPSTGRPRQVSKGGFRTRKEAGDALLQAQAALRSGTFVEPSKRTIRSYLLEEWLPENQPPRLRPSSYANYMIYTRTHVVPRLGDIELQRLTPSNLSGFYRALLTDARRDGQAWPPRRCASTPWHRALKDAVRLGYLVRNVADAVTLPRAPRRRCRSGPRISCAPSWPMLARIACTPSGCSSSPGCAAPSSPGSAGSTSTWTPLGSPPAAPGGGQLRGARVRAQDPDGQAVAGAGPGHLGRPPGAQGSPGAGTGRGRAGLDGPGLVFTRPDGTPIHPDLITDWFRRLARAAGLPPIRLHDVRHSYATRRWPPASRPRWSASASATPPSPSPWTSTATSFPAWTPRPPTPWPA